MTTGRRGRDRVDGGDGEERTKWLWTFHSLRHTAATYLLNEVPDADGRRLGLTQVSVMLGHGDERVTARYYSARTEQQIAHALRALSAT